MEQRNIRFDTCSLPQEQVALIQSPSVANGTYANGLLALDTTQQVETISLQNPLYIVPS
jgi:hypothetical protein